MRKVKELLAPKYGIPLTILGFLLFWLGKWLYMDVLFPEQAVMKAVPVTSPVVVALPEAGALETQGSSMINITLPGVLDRDRELLSHAITRLDSAGQLAEAGEAVLFVQLNGPEGPALGGIIDMGKRLQRPDKFFTAAQVSVTSYRGHEVYSLALPDGAGLSLAMHRNLLVIGRFPFLVEEVIGQAERSTGALPFLDAGPLFPSRGVRYWINADLLNRRWSGTPDFWPPGWLEMTQYRDSARWNLNGRFLPTRAGGLPWLSGTSPALPGGILEILPAQFSWFSWRHCAEPERCWPAVNDGPLRELLLPILEAEQAFVVGDLRGAPANADRFWVLETTGPDEAAASLDELANLTGVLEDYRYQTYQIRQLLSEELRPPLHDPNRQHFVNPYCVVLDRYFVLANSRSGIELLVDQYLVGGNLLRSESFLKYYEANDQPASVWWIADPGALSSLFRGDPVYGAFLESFSLFGLIGFHWQGEAGRPGFHGQWQPRTIQATPRSRLVWRTPLEAQVAQAPQVLYPDDSSLPVVIAQDAANTVYLLDHGGRILWRAPLDYPVRSSFELIDYYRDGARQVLFNTTRGIYLLDLESGRPVADFPIRLKSPATNGLTVMDQTGQGGYAFYLACANGSLYGYNREGLPLEGWDPRRGMGQVGYPIRHFQADGQDYFAVLNDAGVLHVLDQSSDEQFPPVDLEQSPAGAPGVQLHPRSRRIVVCDREGVAEVVNMEGAHLPLPLSRRHLPPVRFEFADVVGDSRKDYIALSGDLLTVEYYEGNDFRQAWRYTFDRRQTDLFVVLLPGTERFAVGTHDANVRQLFLLGADGRPLTGFPLAGTTPFTLTDLYGDGRSILLTGDDNRIVAYEIATDSALE